jgi:hypothetical protein
MFAMLVSGHLPALRRGEGGPLAALPAAAVSKMQCIYILCLSHVYRSSLQFYVCFARLDFTAVRAASMNGPSACFSARACMANVDTWSSKSTWTMQH